MAESNFMMQSTNSSSNSCQPRLPPVLDDRLSYLEEQVIIPLSSNHVYTANQKAVSAYFTSKQILGLAEQ